jgi:protein arginine kinase
MPIRPRWLSESGPDSDVSVSTRCRIARNLAGVPFPWRATPLQLKTSAETLLNATERAGASWQDAESIPSDRLTQEHVHRLVETRLASLAWTRDASHRWLVVGRGGTLSLLVNEEDHARIQSIYPGFAPEAAFDEARSAAQTLESSLDFAQNDRIGYLTAALTNAGTGLRLSVILHLPALVASGGLEPRLNAARELGASVRGLYGEGTQPAGSFFQISNRRAFGLHERDILSEVSASAGRLIEAERASRSDLYGASEGRVALAEKVYDALVDLQSRDPEPAELLQLISLLRLGAAEKLILIDMAAPAEWLSIAGTFAALEKQAGASEIRFQAGRRSAVLRQRLRGLLETKGTFTGEIAG